MARESADPPKALEAQVRSREVGHGMLLSESLIILRVS